MCCVIAGLCLMGIGVVFAWPVYMVYTAIKATIMSTAYVVVAVAAIALQMVQENLED